VRTSKAPACERRKSKGKDGKVAVCTEYVTCHEVPIRHISPESNISSRVAPSYLTKRCVHNSKIKVNISDSIKKASTSQISGHSCKDFRVLEAAECC
jgi:hypothetical protein